MHGSVGATPLIAAIVININNHSRCYDLCYVVRPLQETIIFPVSCWPILREYIERSVNYFDYWMRVRMFSIHVLQHTYMATLCVGCWEGPSALIVDSLPEMNLHASMALFVLYKMYSSVEQTRPRVAETPCSLLHVL